jgi:hypothetical protein
VAVLTERATPVPVDAARPHRDRAGGAPVPQLDQIIEAARAWPSLRTESEMDASGHQTNVVISLFYWVLLLVARAVLGGMRFAGAEFYGQRCGCLAG